MNPRHTTRENSMVISVATPDFWAIPGTNNIHLIIMGFSGGSDSKESTCNVGDLGSIPGLGWSLGGGHGNPLQYSCLENPHGQRSLEGYSPWGHKQLDTTEWLSTAQHIIFSSGTQRVRWPHSWDGSQKLSWHINPFSTNYLLWTASRYFCYWTCCQPCSAPWCPRNSPSWSWPAWDCGWSCRSLCCSRPAGGQTTWVHSQSCSACFPKFSLSRLGCLWSVATGKMHGTTLDSVSRMDTERGLSCKNHLGKTLLVNPSQGTSCLTRDTTDTSLMYTQVTHHTECSCCTQKNQTEKCHKIPLPVKEHREQ